MATPTVTRPPQVTEGYRAYLAGAMAALLLVTGFWYAPGRPRLPEPAAADWLQCVSYSPFTRDQSPLEPPFEITDARLRHDFSLLSRHFECVRTYSVQGLEAVPDIAREHGLKVLAGAWIGRDALENQREIEGLVRLANQHPDTVTALIVGNEVLLRREMGGAELARLVHRVRSRVTQPVTYADVWSFWLQHPEIAPAVDFLTIHLLPYWEDQPAGIGQALDAVRQVRERMGRLYPDLPILIGETGWPSAGRQRQTASPGRVNQARFIRGFVQMAEREGWRYNLIEAFDQPWKRRHEGAVGGYWGLFDTHREDKGILSGPVSDLPAWPGWWAASLALSGVLLILAGRPGGGQRAALVPLLATTAGTLAVYHGQHALVNARGWSEWAWFGAEIALSLVAATYLLLRLTAPAVTGWRARLSAWLQARLPLLLLALGFGAAVIMLQLAFEPRYRDFPFAPYLLPAAGFLWLSWRGQLPGRPELPWLGLLLVLAIPPVLLQETLTNASALLWAAVSLALALALAGTRTSLPLERRP